MLRYAGLCHTATPNYVQLQSVILRCHVTLRHILLRYVTLHNVTLRFFKLCLRSIP